MRSLYRYATYAAANLIKHKNTLRSYNIKCQIFCPILTRIWDFSTDFVEIPNTKFHENPSTGTCDDICGQTNMTKVTVSTRLEVLISN